MEFNYEGKFWQGLPIITNNFEKKNRELTILNYVFTEYSAIVTDFAKALDRLSSFKLDFDEEATYGQGISSFFALLKKESEINLKKSDTIIKTIVKSIEKNSSQLKKELEFNVKDFNLNEEKYFKSLRELDNHRIHFHSLIKQVDQENMNEFIQNSTAQLSKSTPEEQSDKIVSSIQNIIDKAKEMKEVYINNIATTNKAREYYMRTANGIFQTLQLNDTKLLEVFKETLNTFININQQYYNELSECYSKCEMILNIDTNTDIANFIMKNQTKGYEPFEAEFIPYAHQSEVLPIELSTLSVQEQEEFNENRLELLNSFKIDDSDQKNDWPQIENFARLSFEGQLPLNDKNTLLKLFSKESNQRCYLNYLNQTRTKGHYIINDQAFTTIGELLNGILNNIAIKDIKDINYGLVQYCIIISQTYGKPAQTFSDEKILVQKEIMTNDLWKKKEVWRYLIKSAINSQLNNKSSHIDYCQGMTSEKNDVVDKSSFSNILTYADTLKSFCFPINDIMEILHPLCKLYKVDEKIVEEVSKRDDNEDGQAEKRSSSLKNLINRNSNMIDELKNNEDLENDAKYNEKNIEKKINNEVDQGEEVDVPHVHNEEKRDEDELIIENKRDLINKDKDKDFEEEKEESKEKGNEKDKEELIINKKEENNNNEQVSSN